MSLLSESSSAESSSDRRPVSYDIVFFGVLMILSGFMDLYIIFANPKYQLPIFGMKFAGPAGWFFKLAPFLLHFIAGYGMILGRRWAYLLLMLYSLYGIVNATANRMLLPGPHRIRTIFVIGTLLFMGYLYWRREAFNR